MPNKKPLLSSPHSSYSAVELGMGIHGEPGAERQLLSQGTKSNLANDIISHVCSRLNAALAAKQELAMNCTGLAVMVNNLGAVSQAEMLIVCKAVADYIFSAEASILNGKKFPVHMYSGSFMTSLQMTGVSISCLMIPSDNGHMSQLLHEPPSSAVAWNLGFQLRPPSERTMILAPVAESRSTPVTGSRAVPNAAVYHASPQSAARNAQYSPSNITLDGGRATGTSQSGLHARTEAYIIAITTALISHANELTSIDRKTGDGDFGDTGTNINIRSLLNSAPLVCNTTVTMLLTLTYIVSSFWQSRFTTRNSGHSPPRL